jgi:O-antigen ligase
LITRQKPESARDETGPLGPVVFPVAAFIIAFAPLVRGGNRPAALMVLELAGLLVLAALALSPTSGARAATPPLVRVGVAILLVVPLLQLLPVPLSWWRALPGHEPYAQALDLVVPLGEAAWQPITLHARATQYAWLVLVPCVAVFFALRAVDRRALRRLVVLFVTVAACEAVLGILQVGAGPKSLLQLDNPYATGAANGTYVNRNHFAALIAMALPMMLAMWSLEVLPRLDQRGERLLAHPRDADARLAYRIVLSIVLVVLVAALIFTRSRAGIGAGFLASALAVVVLFWREGSLQIRVVLILVALAGVLLAAYAGLTPLLERLAPEELAPDYEGRMQVAAATMRAGLDFLPLGSGLGTFADVFPRYQPERLAGFFDHAHNDYAEAFLELGVAGVVAIALLAVAYGIRWRELALRSSRSLWYLQAAAGFAMLAMAMHSAFDFNFHIPANAIYFSFFAGVFFYEPAEVTRAADRA